MQIAFTKMNGAGNDFIAIDNRNGNVQLSPEQIAHLCNRHAGIGADGLFLARTATSGKAPWAWDFFNSDGSDAEMCGNGARCFATFLRSIADVGSTFDFETVAGVIRASFDGELVTVGLTRPEGLALGNTLDIDGRSIKVHSLNTGVPHAVVFVPDADEAMVQDWGKGIRFHPHFAPKGTNVNFAQILDTPNAIRVRTYERGVEGETLACGTGVTASAIIASKVHGLSSPVAVTVQSGDKLEVSFDPEEDSFGQVQLKGPGVAVYTGSIAI